MMLSANRPRAIIARGTGAEECSGWPGPRDEVFYTDDRSSHQALRNIIDYGAEKLATKQVPTPPASGFLMWQVLQFRNARASKMFPWHES